MSSIDEIREALSSLNGAQLREIEAAIHRMYRERGESIIYDDAYGLWTEEDQTSVAAGLFRELDQQENGNSEAR